MKCGDNKQFKIRMSKKEYKHGPLINLEERSGAMDEWAFNDDLSHPPFALRVCR